MKAKVTRFDKGYLIERPGNSHCPWILGVQGTPYEMGYQHGYLLAEIIQKTASGFLSPVYAQFGGWQPEKGQSPSVQQMETGRELMSSVYRAYFEPAILGQAPELHSEMTGIASGLKAAGLTIPAEDIFIGNCIPEITEMQFYLPQAEIGDGSNAVPAKGCSDCITWGRATVDGRLIHGSNYDYSTYNVLHKGIGVTVVKPDAGYAFIAQCLAGFVGHYRGMNIEAVTTGEPTSDSADRDICSNSRIPHAMHMRKIIQNAAGVEDAVSIMQHHQGTTGFSHVVGDGKKLTAVDIEASCNQMTVIYSQTGTDALWSTNHFVSYPGFKGYEGANLVKDQLKWWDIPWEQVATVAKWKDAVKFESAKRTFSWHRYEALEKSIRENYGRIDIQKMIDILGTYPLSRPPDPKMQISPACDQLYGITGPIVDQRLASVFSVVFDTGNLTAWVAVGAAPAQAGPYWPFRLAEYLDLLDTPAFENNIPELPNPLSKDGGP